MLYERGFIMGKTAQYIIAVVSSAMISTIITTLIKADAHYGVMVRLLCGVFMAITALSPLTNFSADGIFEFWDSFQLDGQDWSSDGSHQASSAKADIIKQQSEAYILEKAGELELQLEVAVTLNDDLIPDGITIHGNAAPTARKRLQNIIENDVGIRRENQIWN
jgi:hypothetical protein